MGLKSYLNIFFLLLYQQAYTQENDCLCSKEEISCISKIDPTQKTVPDLKSKITFTAKTCSYVGNGIVTAQEKKFCLNFAADYYYRLRFTEEDLVYANIKNTQTMHRSKLSSKGALFMLAQVIMESGWGVGGGYSTHNYWGLGGAYQTASGGTTFMSFPSFEVSFAFLFNHFQRGISGDATDSKTHPGWPDFLKMLTKDNFSTDEINQSLNSGKWCRGHPAYNVDPNPNCKSKTGCTCVDYAYFIIRHALSGIARQCIPTWKKALENKEVSETSIVYPKSKPGLPSKRERISKSLQELSQYAQERCLDSIK